MQIMFSNLICSSLYLFYVVIITRSFPHKGRTRLSFPKSCSPNLSTKTNILLMPQEAEETKRLVQYTDQTVMRGAGYEWKKDPDYNCEDWNVEILLSDDSYMKYINVSFKICDGYQNCFHSYVLYLYWMKSILCDPYEGTLMSVHELSMLKNQSAGRSFKNLANGHYCVIVKPCLDICYENWSRNSAVITIWDAEKPEISNNIPVQDYKNLTIAASVVFSLAFLFALGILWWKYNSNAVETIKTSNISDLQEGLPIIAQNIQVYIIHSHDKENMRKVLLLKDFLHCAKYDVILDDDVMHEILINPNDWFSEMLEYKCSMTDACDSPKRFIIVEPANPGLCFDNKAVTLSKNESDVDELEESWYHSIINCISADWRKCLIDYCHIFVVNFNDAPSMSKNLRHVTGRVRYTIPDHLIDLCLNFEKSKSQNSDERQNELKKLLDKHPIKNIAEKL